jgi:hypothetical protein
VDSTVHDTLVLTITLLDFCKCLHTGTTLSFLLMTFVLAQFFVSYSWMAIFFSSHRVFSQWSNCFLLPLATDSREAVAKACTRCAKILPTINVSERGCIQLIIAGSSI